MNFGLDSEPQLKLLEKICGILKETMGDFSGMWTDFFFFSPRTHVVRGVSLTLNLLLLPNHHVVPSTPLCQDEAIGRVIRMLGAAGNFILRCMLYSGKKNHTKILLPYPTHS